MRPVNGVTPFEMMFGREMVLPEHLMFNLPVSIEQVPQESVEYVDHLKKRFQLVYQYVRQHAQKGMQRQKTGYDQKENTPCVFQRGDHVWLYTPAVPRGKSPKFHRPWQGPYEKGRSHIRYPTTGTSTKKINSALQSIETVFSGNTSWRTGVKRGG